MNIAFPPTVNAEINAASITLTKVLLNPVVKEKLIASIAPIEPEIIPHISPTISLHTEDILLLFFINTIPCLAPFIFLLFNAWNVASFAVIAAVPITSNNIPNEIVTTSTINNIILLHDTAITFEIVLNIIDKINVELPIHYGTSEKVLASSVGLLEGSSLPVGGAGVHSVLSAHRAC